MHYIKPPEVDRAWPSMARLCVAARVIFGGLVFSIEMACLCLCLHICLSICYLYSYRSVCVSFCLSVGKVSILRLRGGYVGRALYPWGNIVSHKSTIYQPEALL